MAGFKTEITKFHYKSLKGFWGVLFGAILFLPLLFLSFFYYIGINFKNFFYKIGIFKEKSAGAKVICIGNLTTGGVGKTPVTIEFCKYLSKKYKVASLSRGYKGKLKGANIIRDFNGILINNPELTGDEVRLIANSANAKENFAVVTSSDRIFGAKKASEELGAEVIVMDDGFTNRKIKKDISLLLFDVNKFTGNGMVLPFGPLREPLGEINRANAIILIDKENTQDSEFKKIEDALRHIYKFKGEIFRAQTKPDYFYNIKTGEIVDPMQILRTYAFCGIGQPELFYKYLDDTLKMCTPRLSTIQKRSFDDHHTYTKSDIQSIVNSTKHSEYIITTEKDAVKIKPFLDKEAGSKYCGKIFLALKLKMNIDAELILSKLDFKTGKTEV